MRRSDCTLTRAIGFPREKCLTGTFLLFIGLPSIYRLRFTLLVLVTLVLSGCLRVISVDYVPANPYRGQGSVAIGPFQYSASQDRKIGPRHIESNPQGMGQFYLSKDVAEFLADAVAGELTFSGYSVNSTAVLNISGTIERFYYDPVDAQYASLELIVHYTIRVGEKEAYVQTTRAFQKIPKSALAISRLIHAATSDSIHQFLNGARQANVLTLSCP